MFDYRTLTQRLVKGFVDGERAGYRFAQLVCAGPMAGPHHCRRTVMIIWT